MINISLNNLITNIEMFDNRGILSNNLIDYDNNTLHDDINLEHNNFNNRINTTDDYNEDEDNEENEDNEDNEDEDELFNFMGSFVSSINDKKQIPKVLLPMILYTYMKLDPDSIINKNNDESQKNMSFKYGDETNYNLFNYYPNKKLNENQVTNNNNTIGSTVNDLD